MADRGFERAPAGAWLSTPRTLGMCPPTVLVCIPSRARRQDLTDQLGDAGFTVLACPSWTAATALLVENSIDIGVVDSEIADYYSDPPSLTQGGGPVGPGQPGEIPMIFLVDDPARFDWDAYAQLDRAEIISSASVADQLVPRICALAKRLDRQGAERGADDRLRDAVRGISASIRSSIEPTVITERLVRGIAEVFDVDHVYFATLSDGRVPEFAVRWSGQTGELRTLDVGLHRSVIRALAERLWAAGIAYQTSHRPGLAPPAELGELAGWAKALGAESSILVPIGGGDAPFGLIWLASARRRRSFSSAEVVLLQDLAGSVAHGMMQGQVITDQREVLRRLERLDGAKSSFLVTVNHELRTPLTSLTAYLDLVQDGAGGPVPPRAAEMLRVVERNARRLGALVDDVLTMSRMAANDPEADWAPVDLTRATYRVLGRLSTVAATRGVDLASQIPPNVVVEGNAGQLEQVIFQLTDNALKFTEAGGRVEVQVSEHDGADADEPTVEVSIVDTGSGIRPEEVPELFTTFFRGSNAEAGAVAGSGLGLAIVSGLVEAHRGRISVDATASGGTQVRVRLPRTHTATGTRPDPRRLVHH